MTLPCAHALSSIPWPIVLFTNYRHQLKWVLIPIPPPDFWTPIEVLDHNMNSSYFHKLMTACANNQVGASLTTINLCIHEFTYSKIKLHIYRKLTNMYNFSTNRKKLGEL